MIGFDFVEIVQWVGFELILFEDDVGSYMVLCVCDCKVFYVQIEWLVKQYQWCFIECLLDGIIVYLFIVYGLIKLEDVVKRNYFGMVVVIEFVVCVGSYFYWVEDGDFLIFVKVLQVLVDCVVVYFLLVLDGWLKV